MVLLCSRMWVQVPLRYAQVRKFGFTFLKRYTLMDEYDLDLKGFDDQMAPEEDELNDDQDEDMTPELDSVGGSEG